MSTCLMFTGRVDFVTQHSGNVEKTKLHSEPRQDASTDNDNNSNSPLLSQSDGDACDMKTIKINIGPSRHEVSDTNRHADACDTETARMDIGISVDRDRGLNLPPADTCFQ